VGIVGGEVDGALPCLSGWTRPLYWSRPRWYSAIARQGRLARNEPPVSYPFLFSPG